jgi:nitrate/nitrite-specific signal transduction histidine kinase
METLRSGFEVGFYDNITAVRKEHGMLFLIMLVISPVFIYDSVKLSNRFVGPMISFRAALNKLSNGEDPGEIRFRQNDFWKELTNDFNKISGELNQLRGNADDSPSSDEPEATVSA